MSRSVTVFLSYGAFETGIWCDTCMLPSGQAFELTPITENGVGRTVRFSGCPDCGAAIPTAQTNP